jgi:hypothetical protein
VEAAVIVVVVFVMIVVSLEEQHGHASEGNRSLVSNS